MAECPFWFKTHDNFVKSVMRRFLKEKGIEYPEKCRKWADEFVELLRKGLTEIQEGKKKEN